MIRFEAMLIWCGISMSAPFTFIESVFREVYIFIRYCQTLLCHIPIVVLRFEGHNQSSSNRTRTFHARFLALRTCRYLFVTLQPSTGRTWNSPENWETAVGLLSFFASDRDRKLYFWHRNAPFLSRLGCARSRGSAHWRYEVMMMFRMEKVGVHISSYRLHVISHPRPTRFEKPMVREVQGVTIDVCPSDWCCPIRCRDQSLILFFFICQFHLR